MAMDSQHQHRTSSVDRIYAGLGCDPDCIAIVLMHAAHHVRKDMLAVARLADITFELYLGEEAAYDKL